MNAELACLPYAIPPDERKAHFALAKHLFAEKAEEWTDVANGYAIRFQADALEEIARFVANERKCCPFMSFELVLAPESGPLWLRMTGPEGTRDILQAELDVSGSCGCEVSNG
jgi:hypothetical protein